MSQTSSHPVCPTCDKPLRPLPYNRNEQKEPQAALCCPAKCVYGWQCPAHPTKLVLVATSRSCFRRREHCWCRRSSVLSNYEKYWKGPCSTPHAMDRECAWLRSVQSHPTLNSAIQAADTTASELQAARIMYPRILSPVHQADIREDQWLTNLQLVRCREILQRFPVVAINRRSEVDHTWLELCNVFECLIHEVRRVASVWPKDLPCVSHHKMCIMLTVALEDIRKNYDSGKQEEKQ